MEKINVAELLRNCPRGMELDCTIFDGKVCFEEFDNHNPLCPIKISVNLVNLERLDIWGQYDTKKYSKCVIFPKGKTTWEGFVPPCQFKDGDIVAYDSELGVELFIFKEFVGNATAVCYLYLNSHTELHIWETPYLINRLATEEEKAKLFQAIKDNGYRWNFQANRLEKLIKPIFKKGDKVRIKKGFPEPRITRIIEDVCDTFYTLVSIGTIDFTEQDNWELVPNKFDINTLVPFESKVLVRNDEGQYWIPAFWGCKRADGYTTTFGWCKYCIPYEGNEHLLETNNDCEECFKTWCPPPSEIKPFESYKGNH